MADRLTTQQMIDDSLFKSKVEEQSPVVKRLHEVKELYCKVKVFEAVVWFPMLQNLVNSSSSRGMKGTCHDIKIMTWCCAGRCLIQLERNGNSITLITADDEKPWYRDMASIAPNMGPMGIQSLDTEHWEAMKMLYEVTRYWGDIVLVDDGEVIFG